MQAEDPVGFADFERYFARAPIALCIKECARLSVIRHFDCPEPVLDVGCGDGLFTQLAFAGRQVWGIAEAFLFVPSRDWASYMLLPSALRAIGAPSIANAVTDKVDSIFKHHHVGRENGALDDGTRRARGSRGTGTASAARVRSLCQK